MTQPRRSHISLSFGDGQDGHTIQLALKCQDCVGTGLVYSPAWQRWGEQVRALEVQGVDYLEAIDRCKPVPTEPEELQCVECEGAGMQPTQQGRAILDLVRTFSGR